MNFVYFHDQFLPEHEAKISLFNRGFLFGDGVFTTLRIENGKKKYLYRHLKKLETGCDLIKLDYPTVNEETIQELIQLNRAQKGIWRLKIIVTAGDEETTRTLTPRKSLLFVTLVPYEGIFCKPVRLIIYPHAYQSSLSKIKSLACLERLKIQDFALSQGYDEAMVMTPDSIILETAFANLFWKDDKSLYVPDPCLPYYSGVTIEKSLEVASKLGYNISYVMAKTIPRETNVYIVNSLKGICPVEEINGVRYPRDGVFEEQLISLLF